eukprot:5528323-Ditylum_brightwellii.AAC.1
MCLKEWYIDYTSEGGEEAEIEDVFTKETWTKFIIKKFQEEKENEETSAIKEEEQQTTMSPRKSVMLTTKEANSGGLNVSYK